MRSVAAYIVPCAFLILSSCLGFSTFKVPSNICKSRTFLKSDKAGCSTCDDTSPATGSVKVPLTLDKKGPVTAEEICNANLVKIVNLECTDLECDYLAWKCLGYKFDDNSNTFLLSPDVFPKWAAKYPEAPDVIGLARNYSPEVDKPVRDASMNLMRSIPRDYKGGVRALESEGFRGYKLKELTPNKTRRAQLVNWIIYYREKLWGKTVEQLREERMLEIKKSEEIANLPSEKQYEKLRLDVVNEPSDAPIAGQN